MHRQRIEQLQQDNFRVIAEFETVRSDKSRYGLQEEDDDVYRML